MCCLDVDLHGKQLRLKSGCEQGNVHAHHDAQTHEGQTGGHCRQPVRRIVAKRNDDGSGRPGGADGENRRLDGREVGRVLGPRGGDLAGIGVVLSEDGLT